MFHLKGPPVEVLVHLILVLIVFSTVLAILAEIARPAGVLAAAARPWLTVLQGAWWLQTAFIMCEWGGERRQAGRQRLETGQPEAQRSGCALPPLKQPALPMAADTANPAWDPDLMGGSMMVPVPFVLWMLGSATALMCLLLAMKAATEWRLGKKLSFDAAGSGEAQHLHQPLPSDDSAAEFGGGHLELSSLVIKSGPTHSDHTV